MKISYKIATYFVIAISLIHIGLTPIFFDEFTIRVGWFIGVGLMGLFLGFLNISYWRSLGKDILVKRLCLSANIISLVYFVLVITVDKDPQGFLVIALFAYLTFSSIYLSKEKIADSGKTQ